jgi:hypothetical protein
MAGIRAEKRSALLNVIIKSDIWTTNFVFLIVVNFMSNIINHALSNLL